MELNKYIVGYLQERAFWICFQKSGIKQSFYSTNGEGHIFHF